MHIKKSISLIGSLLSLLVLLGAALPSSSAPLGKAARAAEKHQVLTVAFPQLRGMTETDAQGRRTGLVVDYLDEIAKYTNWEYEYIDDTIENLTSRFLAGEIDLMGGTLYNVGLEKYFAFPDYSMGNSRAVLFCREDDERLKGYDIRSLNGKTIGVYAPAVDKIRRLQEYLKNNNLDCELVYYEPNPNYTDLYPYLENGDIDLLLGNDMENPPRLRVVASFDAQPYYIVTQPDRPEILEALNESLSYITNADPDFAADHYALYFPNIRSVDIQLDETDLAFIEQHPVLTVAVVRNWHPFYCINEDNESHQGIIPDLLAEISAFSGLAFRYVYADNYAETIRMVQSGEADLSGCFLDGNANSKLYGLALTKPYVSMNNIVIKNNAVNFPQDNLSGALIYGRALPSDIPAQTVQYFSSLLDGVKAVNQGDVDFVYGLAATLEYEIQGHHFPNVSSVSLINNSNNISLALQRPVQPELLNILNKSISNMTEQERKALLDRNLVSLGDASLSVSEMIYANPVAFVVIAVSFLLLIFSILYFIGRNRVQNALMQSELQRAEADSRAKGEFLSRMSHEIRTPMNAIVGLSEILCALPEIPPKIADKLCKIQASSQYLLALINDILDMSRIESGMLGISAEDFSLSSMMETVISMMRVQAEQKELALVYLPQFAHDMVKGDAIRLRQVLVNLLSNAIKFTPKGGVVTVKVVELAGTADAYNYYFMVSDTGVGIPPESQKQVFGVFEQLGSNISRSEGTGLGLPISHNIVRLMGGELELRSKAGQGSEFFFTIPLPQGAPPAPARAIDTAVLANCHVLLAEDNELNAEIALELLQMQGVSADWVSDGRQAVERFVSSQPGSYQLILMDIQMPHLSGLQAARQIRESDHPDAARIPIVAMTANAYQEDAESALQAGMNDFIPKPVDARYLTEVLQNQLSEQSIKEASNDQP